MAAAGAGSGTRKHVLEIYCGSGLGVYLMKPVNKGLEIFGRGDIVSPKGKDRVGIHSGVIGHGTLHTVVGDGDHTFRPFEPNMDYEQPHVTNPYFDFLRVYENHPMISELVKKYDDGSSANPENATSFIDEVKSMTWEESNGVKPGGSYWLAPSKRNLLRLISPKVLNRVNAIKKKSRGSRSSSRGKRSSRSSSRGSRGSRGSSRGSRSSSRGRDRSRSSSSGRDNGAAAEISDRPGSNVGSPRSPFRERRLSDSGGSDDNPQDGGSRRRRRPSRKYKKSKRVLRRKSRSTRRR